MSNRAVRRAAERQAKKTNKTQQSADLVKVGNTGLTPELIAELDQRYPGDIDFRSNMRTMFDAEAVAEEQSQPTQTTEAQIATNQANAKLSTGPVSPEGKATVSQNRRTHGLTGCFQCLPDENPKALHELTDSVYAEYQPSTDTEKRLADSLIQSYWRMQRAIRLQENIFLDGGSNPDAKKLSLFMRYQTTHERSYYKAQRELQNLQKQKQKEQIGFESQTQVQEAHEARIRLAHAKALNMEVNATCRQTIEAPLPGLTKIPLKEIIDACRTAIATLAYDEQFKTAA